MRTLLLVVAVSLLAGTAFAQDTPKFEASLHSYMRFNPENSNVINSFSLNGGGGAGPRDSGSEAQPHDDWVGQLLLFRTSQQGLSSNRRSRSQEAASVAVCQASNTRVGGQKVRGRNAAWGARLNPPDQADEQFSVGNTVILFPRAGCGCSARPVR
jgi:hypothetical protein